MRITRTGEGRTRRLIAPVRSTQDRRTVCHDRWVFELVWINTHRTIDFGRGFSWELDRGYTRCELRRTPPPCNLVNKGMKKGRGIWPRPTVTLRAVLASS